MKRAYMMIMVAILVGMMAVPAQAKGLSGKVVDPDENLYIVEDGRIQCGHIRYHHKWYYGHITKSDMYPVGSLCRDAFRMDDGKFYYYGRSGAALKKSTHYIKVRRDGSVKWIKIPGSKMRYNCDLQRYQEKKRGRWHDVGMQCLPYGEMDFQQ